MEDCGILELNIVLYATFHPYGQDPKSRPNPLSRSKSVEIDFFMSYSSLVLSGY